MSKKHRLQQSIHLILFRSHEGSCGAQADRYQQLMNFAQDINKLGYGLTHIYGLKEKHVRAVVKQWQGQKLANATIKNRMSAIRYLAEKINKSNVVPSNTDLSIGARKYVSQFNRALYNPDFSEVTDRHIYISMQLQKVFGLRREESLKIKPHLADQGNHLILQPTWCKGGRGRMVPIRTEEQRYWLEEAKKMIMPGDSMIPKDRSYKKHRHAYDNQVKRAGLKNLHGLRHAFAQKLYKEITGWEAPINGGPRSKELTLEQKQIDHQARMIISEELGHSRRQIVSNYIW